MREDGTNEFDEGSWVYLSLSRSEDEGEDELRQGVIAALEENGWPAVTWSPPPSGEALASHFFEGMAHAVEHADAVVVLLGGSSTLVDAELAFAYRHRRPVVALQLSGGEKCASGVRTMLRRYERARTVECGDAAECVSGLRSMLADPSFGEMVDEATWEIDGNA